jgi:hypothetical protein
MPERLPFSPMPGQPNPELEHASGFQKAMLAVLAIGFVVLVGLLAYLPSLATPFK